jgi:RHS repeat-associated protein
MNATNFVFYAYNAAGKPVIKYRKTSGGSWAVDSYLIWDGDNLLLDLDASGNRRADYAYLPGTVDQPITEEVGSTSIAAIREFRSDASGNVIGVVDSLSITENDSYTPWGMPAIWSSSNPLLWKGLMWEGDVAGLYFVRNRWYDPELGRFMSEDPIGHAGGDNLYAFGSNDPVNASDPSGELQYDRHGAVCSIYAKCGEPLELGGSFLGGSSLGDFGRPLTDSEKKVLGDLCKAANCDAVRIYNAPWRRSGTWDHMIFIGADDRDNPNVVFHEMVHVVQYEKLGAWEYAKEGFPSMLPGNAALYDYLGKLDGRRFFGYGLEQQAQIFEDCTHESRRLACGLIPFATGAR